jgi:hypothetical protein
MECPHCQSDQTNERSARTGLGYRRFRCRGCHREFHKRTGTGGRLYACERLLCSREELSATPCLGKIVQGPSSPQANSLVPASALSCAARPADWKCGHHF